MIMIYVKLVGGSTIRNITINVADENDLEFVQGLQNLGVNRNVANLITYLKDVEEASSRDIERVTGLRQPEVSIAMRTLRERGWVTEHEVRQEGKGRPMKIYALGATIDEIINYYEDEKTQESTQTLVAIQRLKELSAA
jgi:predicted transcriptional regulator